MNDLVAVAAKISPAHVVHKEDDDVRSAGSGGEGEGTCAEEEEEQEKALHEISG